MRKLLLIITCLAFVSCSKDDDPATEAKLSGEWELTSQEQTFYDNDGNEYEPTTPTQFFTKLRFSDDGRGDIYYGNEWVNNVLIVKGDAITINHESAEGGQLTIESISNNSLSLSFKGVVKVKQGDWTFGYDCDLRSNYKRVK